MPTSLTFNAQNGVTPPPQTLTITSTLGATKVTVSAFSDTNWLMVTPMSGTTPLQVTVSVNPSLTKLAQDFGFVNISSGGTFAPPVVVELNTSGVSAGSPITANPSSLSFNFPANSTVPVTKPVMLTSNASGVDSFTANATTNDGGHWITLNPMSGTLPATLDVTVNPNALSGSGPFNATVAILPPGTAGTTVGVTVTVGGVPAVQTSPAQLNFAWQLGTAAPASQMVSVTSSGTAVSFTAAATTSSCGSNWLVVSPASGVTPGSVTAEINTSVLTTAQTCSGAIQITAVGASNSTVSIPVSLLVSSNPLLLVPSSGPTFTYQIGTSLQLAPQNVQITSSSSALNFSASVAPTTAGAPTFLVAAPLTATTPQALTLTVIPGVLSGLAPGTYSDTVTLTSAGAGNSPQSFPVTLTVSSTPLLTASVSSLIFNYQIGQAAPLSQAFTVSSTGSPVSFQVSASSTNCSGFLTVMVNNGSPAVTFGNQNEVVVGVNVTGVKAGTCDGTVTVSVPNSSTPALTIPVTLNVSEQPLLNLSTTNITVTTLVGASPSTQTVGVTSTNSSVITFTSAAATNPIGLTWLSVAPNTGNTPNNLLVTLNPANLGVGTYNGTITVTAPNVPSQVIRVTLVIASSNITANPTSLTLTEPLGGTPVSQNVQITGVPSGTTIGALATTLSGTGWLTTSVAGNTVTVTADATNLQQSSYNGVVAIIAPGAGNSPLYIPVTFNVTAANTLTLSATSASFNFSLGGSVPQSQSVQVTSTVAGLPFTAGFNPTSGGAFLTVTPSNGTTPATLTLALNPEVLTALGVGTYTGNVVVSSAAIAGDPSITVTLTVTPAPGPGITSVVNAASFVPGPISPGELISIFGTNMGPTTGVGFTPDNGHVDTTLAGTMVLFNNTPAPLIYVSATQINAIVPYDAGSFAIVSVNVDRSGALSSPLALTVADTAPGIFSANQTGNGQGAILNENNSPNSLSNPAPRGSIVSIYMTGEGALSPAVATGSISGPSLPLPKPLAPVTATIGGQPADISYAGEAPTLVSGVLQVNAKIPENISSGNQIVVVTIGNNTNQQQSITVAVQ
jgi:uncharacterized protein (TIGR03437 family)